MRSRFPRRNPLHGRPRKSGKLDAATKEEVQIGKQIMRWLTRKDLDHDATLYTHKEWKRRGESYGRGAIFAITTEGGLSYLLLNYANTSAAYALQEDFSQMLAKYGLYYELSTAWIVALYPIVGDIRKWRGAYGKLQRRRNPPTRDRRHRLPRNNAKALWMRQYAKLTGDPQPKPIDYWATATHLYNQGMSPEEAADRFRPGGDIYGKLRQRPRPRFGN